MNHVQLSSTASARHAACGWSRWRTRPSPRTSWTSCAGRTGPTSGPAAGFPGTGKHCADGNLRGEPRYQKRVASLTKQVHFWHKIVFWYILEIIVKVYQKWHTIFKIHKMGYFWYFVFWKLCETLYSVFCELNSVFTNKGWPNSGLGERGYAVCFPGQGILVARGFLGSAAGEPGWSFNRLSAPKTTPHTKYTKLLGFFGLLEVLYLIYWPELIASLCKEFMWLFKTCLCENALPQIVHLWFFSPSCTDFMCLFRCSPLENALSHSVHLWFFSPSCTVLIWILRLPCWENNLPHIVHL